MLGLECVELYNVLPLEISSPYGHNSKYSLPPPLKVVIFATDSGAFRRVWDTTSCLSVICHVVDRFLVPHDPIANDSSESLDLVYTSYAFPPESYTWS